MALLVTRLGGHMAIRMIAGAMAFAVATVAMPASAAMQILSFSGTLNNQSRNGSSGPFFQPNQSLDGLSFTVSLRYELADFAGTSNCGSATSAACTFTLNSSRTITQMLTVFSGQQSVTQTDTLTSGSFALNSNGNDNFSFGITGTGIISLQGNFTATNANMNGFFPTPVNVSNAAFNNFSGLAVQSATFNQTTTNQTTTGYNVQARGGTITSLSASNVTAAVPEPATWAMMMLGFGGVGYALRRRKQVTRIRFA